MNRIKYIDALRGTTMLLVVFGHIISMGFGLNGYTNAVNSFFITFRMPLFFFISGFIGYKALEKWDLSYYRFNLKKKAIVQVIPATLFFIFYCATKDKPIFGFLRNGWDLYWYTIALLEMFFIYYTISLICRKRLRTFADILMIIVSMLGIAYVAYIKTDIGICKVLNIIELGRYFQFFTLGVLFRKHSKFFFHLIEIEWFKVAVFITFSICFLFYNSKVFESTYPLFFKFLHDIVIRYCGLFVIFTFFYMKRDFFDQKNKLTQTICFIGRRTLDIYLIHYFFIPDLTLFADYLEPSNQSLLLLIISFILTFANVFFCMAVSEFIRISDFLAYYLLGVKRKRTIE